MIVSRGTSIGPIEEEFMLLILQLRVKKCAKKLENANILLGEKIISNAGWKGKKEALDPMNMQFLVLNIVNFLTSCYNQLEMSVNDIACNDIHVHYDQICFQLKVFKDKFVLK